MYYWGQRIHRGSRAPLSLRQCCNMGPFDTRPGCGWAPAAWHLVVVFSPCAGLLTAGSSPVLVDGEQMPPQMALIVTSAGSGMGKGKDQVAQGTSKAELSSTRATRPGWEGTRPAVTGTGCGALNSTPPKSKNSQTSLWTQHYLTSSTLLPWNTKLVSLFVL